MKRLFVLGLISLVSICSVLANGQEESKGVTELHYANFSTEGEAHHDMVCDSIDEYNKANEGVAVIYNDQLPSAAYTTNIQAVAASNDLPEISMLRASQAQAYGQNGIVIPLNDLMDEYGISQRLRKDTTKESSVDGVCYGIPWSLGYYGFILYNEDIFKECGITSFPKDLDEFKIACDKIKAKGYIPMAMGDKPLWPADSLTFSSFVNKFVGNEWTDNMVAKNGKSKFTDPEVIAAFTAFQKLAKDGTFNENLASLNHDDRRVLYSNKKAAMISAGDWECRLINEEAPDVASVTRVAAWPGPKENAKAGDSIEHSSAWSISLSSKNTDAQNKAAMDYLANYQMTEEWGIKRLEAGGSIAAWKHDVTDDMINQIMARVYAYPAQPCLNWDAVIDVNVREIYQRGLQSLLTLTITPQELAQKMQDEYEMSF